FRIESLTSESESNRIVRCQEIPTPNTHTHLHTPLEQHTHTHLCSNTHTPLDQHTHTYTHTHTHTHTHIHPPTHTLTHLPTHTHTHTHSHTHPLLHRHTQDNMCVHCQPVCHSVFMKYQYCCFRAPITVRSGPEFRCYFWCQTPACQTSVSPPL